MFTLVVYSSRSKTADGRAQMWGWMKHEWGKWAHHSGRVLADDDVRYTDFEFASEKPPAFLTIDDRAVAFRGIWDELHPAALRDFKPWNAR